MVSMAGLWWQGYLAHNIHRVEFYGGLLSGKGHLVAFEIKRYLHEY